jgi:hypothetical protein
VAPAVADNLDRERERPVSALVRRAEALFRAAEALGVEATAIGYASIDDPRAQHILGDLNAAAARTLLLARALVGEVEDAERRAAASAGAGR